MTDGADQIKPPVIDVTNELLQNAKLSANVADHYALVSRKGVKLALVENLTNHRSLEVCLAITGLFVAIFGAVLTANFDEKHIGITGDGWFAIFAVGSVLTFGWTVYAWIRFAVKNVTIDQIVTAIIDK